MMLPILVLATNRRDSEDVLYLQLLEKNIALQMNRHQGNSLHIQRAGTPVLEGAGPGLPSNLMQSRGPQRNT